MHMKEERKQTHITLNSPITESVRRDLESNTLERAKKWILIWVLHRISIQITDGYFTHFYNYRLIKEIWGSLKEV